jgi:hypothetical protein
MPIKQNEIAAQPYAGLYMRTQRQTRFWGWSSRGWGSLHSAEAERPVKDLAAWLRLAHASLDGERSPVPAPRNMSSATAAAQDDNQFQPQSRKERRLQFVCNRRFIGLVIR